MDVPPAEASPFGLGHATPDAVVFSAGQGVGAAFGEHGAVRADLLGTSFAAGAGGSLFAIVGREEHVGIGAAA